MKRKILMMLALCLLAQWSVAQAPKWVEKAKRAVFSIVTYDENDKILNTGNGFFISEDGVALSDYTLFRGAHRAVVMNSEGVQMPVESVMGANDMYDVIKFKVSIQGKKVPALVLAATAPVSGAEAYLLPYATQKDRSYTAGKVQEVDKFSGEYGYYTLAMQLKDKMVSCPVVTTEGEVFGLAQKSSGQDSATVCYAIDARFAVSLSVSALSYNDASLQGIGIQKALPDTEEQALVFLYMASSQLPAEQYMELLDRFVAQYPGSADGYMRRASQRLVMGHDNATLAAVKADMDKALEMAVKKDDVYFNRAKMIYSYAIQAAEPAEDPAWTLDQALKEVQQAIAIEELPIYVQQEGDIQYARQDFPAALACYEKVSHTNLSSAAVFFSMAKSKERMEAPAEEIVALLDSCVACFTPPYTAEAAPYLFERGQARMNANQARAAIQDYDAYFNAVNGQVNDLFYYYREQAAIPAKQFQRALDDLAKAIELNPKELTYRAELAVVNLRIGRNEEAVSVLKAALEVDPNYAEAFRLLGIAQIQMKQKDEACKSFAKAKELGDPNVGALIEKHCK